MDKSELIENRTFDEITIGESASLERTVTKQDIELYATVSGDANPTHLDEAFAKQAKLMGMVAHSMFSAGLISSVLGNRLPGAGTVYLAQELRFAAPVYAADTITVTVTAREKRGPGAATASTGTTTDSSRRASGTTHSTPRTRTMTARSVRASSRVPAATGAAVAAVEAARPELTPGNSTADEEEGS